jgi:hypothetical protein
VIGQRELKSDKPYKHAFVEFVRSKQWHWFITIPIGLCDNDEAVLRRLRSIEASLCGKHLLNRYHRLPDEARFSSVIGFEGEAKCGTRHAHILAYVPPSMKKRISHSMLISLFPLEFRFLWNKYAPRHSFSPWFEERDFPYEIEDEAAKHKKTAKPVLRFGPANIARSIYAVKGVRQHEVPWSRFEFVTPPKFEQFKNENLSVIQHRDRQRRAVLGLS